MNVVKFISLFVALVAGTYGQNKPKKEDLNPCGGTKLSDMRGSGTAVEAREFVKQLQQAVSANDKNAVAALVKYPLRVNEKGKSEYVRSPASFVSQYDRLLGPQARRSIVDKHAAECLFVNAQGFMIGRGEIWFDRVQPAQMRVIAINHISK